jgi:hypothetical protein
MELSEKEKQLILKLRKKKQEKDDRNTPKFEGFAKENIFLKKDLEDMFESNDSCDWLTTQSELDKYIKQLKSFKPVIPKGTRFVCFLFDGENGEKEWFDDIGYGLESMPDFWAEEYLKDIRKI